MIDHEDIIKDALEDIPELKSISGTWPSDKTKYPTIVVELASDSSADHRDDRPYLIELVYYLRIFDTDKKRMRAVLTQADERMAEIGYQRVFRFEQNEAHVKQWVTRYTTTVPADG